ncbi:amidohydrolase [Desulfosporosinus metallidurans]|uniref:S-adenosylhomocysteine deaminase n=1 Tax=Desulfosporosinus metallidurans TaxID=1888891 RepID=A0A1Q8QMK4_9FIRM|nr:amidohydrolase [Desulfosporosinus metallidurans]OLN28567.1 S-adenosylhomocysteine deaminase [Desulfosporosinus metallidurans]
MKKYDLIVRNCSCLRSDLMVESSKDIGITNGIIADIADSGTDISGDTIVDGQGKLVIPGLVDGHTHVCQQFLRGRTLDEFPMIWARILIPFESNLEPEDVYWSTQLACLEMIKSGTTSFADAGGRYMEQAVEATIDAGMRAFIARSTMDMGAFIPDSMKDTIEDNLKRTEELFAEYNGAGDGRISIWCGIRQVMTCSPTLIKEISELARQLNTGIHMHLAEHRDEVSFCLQNYGLRPAELLESLNALGPNLLAAHSVALSEKELELLNKHQVKIVHCPRNNFDSHGFPKTPRMLQMGMTVGLGSDGSATSSLSLFDEMKVFRSGIHAYWGLPIFDPVVLTAEQLILMITQGGAKSVGLGDLGSIDIGKKADLSLINLEQPHILPTHNILKTLVEAVTAHDVTDVVINGRLVMKNREVLTLDEEKIMFEAKKRLKVIGERAGI